MTGRGAAVASEHELISAAVLEVLGQGGNAVDAAVAGAAAQGVCRPFSGGLGGGGFMLIYRPDAAPVVIEHREQAALAFGPHSFRDDRGRDLDGAQRRVSGRSVGVPGAPRAWAEAVHRYGRRTLAEVLAPAAAIARAGFPVDPTFHREIADRVADFRLFESTRRLYLTPDGDPLPVGATMRNPDLAASYELLAERGADAFSQGPAADAMLAALLDPPAAPGATVQRGEHTKEDFARYVTHHVPPTRGTYRGLTVLGAGPPSSGGITVGEALNILEGFPLRDLPEAEVFHLYIEACRLAFADRDAYVGDPAFVDVPVAGLLDKAFAARRRDQIGPRAFPGQAPAADPALLDTPGGRYAEDGSCTIHLTVADDEGWVVCYTNTIISMGGNGMVVPGHGFLLNDAMGFRTADRAGPRGATTPRGGMRPLSSMSPTLLLDGDRPALALGAPGNSTIITSVLQVILGVVDLGRPLSDAVSAPRASQQNVDGGATLAEPAFVESPLGADLSGRGHAFTRCDWPEGIGVVNSLQWDPDGTVQAVAEPWRRGGGDARVATPI